MDTLYPCCAGLDVHKKTVVACVRRLGPGGAVHQEVRTFGTMTAHLLALSDWLVHEGVTHVAMESTGVYGKPIFNLLEGAFQVVLVNPQHLKRVPRRKTDVKDCAWIAQLLQCGLLQPSFIPPRPIRELRELTRQRVQLVAEKTAAANRIHKALEGATIKLASVATDVLGLSGRAMIRALIAGEENPTVLANLARGVLQKKLPALEVALQGRMTEHHRFVLQLLLDHIEALERLIERLDRRIGERSAPFEGTIRNLDTIPGINRRGAECLVAELGKDMDQFPQAANLASWAGLCPGNRESGGKSQGGRTRKGNRWLRRMLVQAAWAASRKRGSYLRAQYRRLKGRRGAKRAAVAVAHTLLVISYQVIKRGVSYQELGEHYFDRLKPEELTRSLVRRLERLGHKVTLEAKDDAA
jgi:transposase